MESDEELRARLIYVTGDGPAWIARLTNATGPRLDEIAETVSLRRRRGAK